MSIVMLAVSACGSSDNAPTDNVPAADNAASDGVSTAAVAASAPTLFNRCAACHTVDKGGRNGIGPNLHGVVNRSIGSIEGFNYSNALKSKTGNWDEASLDAYITSPAKFAPGTRMAFSGISKAEDRKVLINYLASLK